MNEDKNAEMVIIPAARYKELEKIAKTSDWQKGYNAGVQDGVNYALQILQAAKE